MERANIEEIGSDGASHNRELIRLWAEYWGPNHRSDFVSLFADDATYEDVPIGHVWTRQKGLEELYDFNLGCFPDFSVTLTAVVARETSGAAEWIMTGTHNAELLGIPPTGRRMRVRAASFIEFKSGAILRQTDYWSLPHMLKQLETSV
jgi:steroid delta-isomerase-like uncharacterized protein